VPTLEKFVSAMMREAPELLVAALTCNPRAHARVMESVAAASVEEREQFAAMVQVGTTQEYYRRTLRPLAARRRASHSMFPVFQLKLSRFRP